MILIHRSEPVVHVGRKRIQLTLAEHRLLISLGMMDNRIVPPDLLIATTYEHATKIADDRRVLWSQIFRLRQKIGHIHLKHRRSQGYILVGEIHFE